MGRAKEGLVTDGARDLRVYLDAKKLSISRFCELHELDRIEVQRHLRGLRDRVSVDFAIDIRDATNGAIKVERWGHSKEIRAKLFDRRSKARRRVA